MGEDNNGATHGPSIDGMIRRQRMDGEDTVSLEVRGGPGDSLDTVMEAWDERCQKLLDELEDETTP